MEENLLLKPVPKKRRKKIFQQKKYPFPIFFNEGPSTSTDTKFKCYVGHLDDNCVLVSETESIKRIYMMGFFGKGTLSRSTPKVCFQSQKINKTTEDSDESASDSEIESDIEDVVSNEKKDETERKHEDSTAEEENKSDTSDVEEPDETSFKRDTTSKMDSSEINTSDIQEIDVESEKLQLTFEEAFFLSYALGCLVVMDKNQPLDIQRLWQKFCDLTPDMRFPIMYTAYHHFRSKGWVVRSGLKYGTDFVLYKDGPPFYHSTYAVIVKDLKEKQLKDTFHNTRLQPTWASLAAMNRTVTHTGKGLLFLYVIRPESVSENKILTPFCISTFILQEVLVKRWVPEEGRENES